MSKIFNLHFWIENDPTPPWNYAENSSVLVAPPAPYPDWVSHVYIFRFFAIHCLQHHHNDSQVFQLRVLTPSGQFANLQLMTGLSRDNFTRFSTRSPPPLSDYPHCVGTSAVQLKIR